MTKSAAILLLMLFVLMKWKDFFLSINVGLVLWVSFLLLLVVGVAKFAAAQFSGKDSQSVENGIYIIALLLLVIQEAIF